jgi:RecJ-like exonuclease
MKVTALLCGATLAVATHFSTVRAADETPKPATPAPEVAKVYAPTDLDALRPEIGQMVAVEGTIVVSGESKTKTVRYLNFTKNYKESLGLVFFTNKGGEEFALEKLVPWVGKKVRVTGKVGEHNGALQIEIEKWDQVQEVP